MSRWRKWTGKGEEQYKNRASTVLSNTEIQQSHQKSIRTEVAPDAVGHRNPPQDHHLHQQRNFLHREPNAQAREQRSQVQNHTSRASHLSASEKNGYEEGREKLPTFEELRQAFEHFQMDDYSRSHFSNVIQYVHALQAENNKLARSRDDAKNELRSLGQKATSLILELHPPNSTEEMAQKGPFTTSDALRFLLDHYKSLWETNITNREKIVVVNREKTLLIQQLDRQNISHQEQLDRTKAELESSLVDEKCRHSNEKEAINTLHHEQRQKLEGNHRYEIDELMLEHEKLKAKLEGDIYTLQGAFLKSADRFQPRPDSDLRSQFEDLRTWVGRIARSPLDVDGVQLGEQLDRLTFIQLAPKRHYKFALESCIWVILMDGIFATPFRIFGDYSSLFSTLWSQLVQENQHPTNYKFDNLQPEIFAEKWRRINFEPLRQAVIENTTKRPADEMIRNSYEKTIAKIFQSISAVLSRVSSHDKQTEIRKIVDKACLLALDCGEQRCRLELFAPSLQCKVYKQNANTYKDMNGDNDPSLAEGTVQLVVSPGLRRTGDVRGESLDEVVDLCPAAVYLTESEG